jgi:hypothetical protein
VQVGDLVALSAYGERLTDLRIYSSLWRANHFSKKPLMGIIVEEVNWIWIAKPSQKPFRVRWFNEPDPKLIPNGRGGRSRENFFTRKDLKIVSSSKKKKTS